MTQASPEPQQRSDLSIWWFAFGYFACYAPYAALTKALTKGLFSGMAAPLNSFALLPPSVLASTCGMFIFLTAMGWWKYATRRTVAGVTIPSPTLWTALSGICTATIVVTTTLAYTFTGVSIVFVMLLMRGGVLVIAPMIDTISRRKVQWYSWAGLSISVLALLVATLDESAPTSTAPAGANVGLFVNIGLYLFSYFVRLQFMSRLAKGADPNANARFFVEEQMVATPAALLALFVLSYAGMEKVSEPLRYGFTGFWSEAWWIVALALCIGILSQGTGVFGGLILLDKRENTYCVPVNRASSVLAGVVGSFGLTLFLGQKMPKGSELLGAGLIIAAIVVLTLPVLFKKKKA